MKKVKNILTKFNLGVYNVDIGKRIKKALAITGAKKELREPCFMGS